MISQPFADLVAQDGAFLKEIIQTARAIKATPRDYASSLNGRVLYGLFQKTSTRTHLSYAKAITALGGAYVSQPWEQSNFAIADVETEAAYVSTTADAIVARLLSYKTVMEFCAASTVPFINGCCDRFHPSQAVADCLTLTECFGDLTGRKIVYAGVFNNVLNSLAISLPRLGAKLVALAPIVNPASHDERVLAIAKMTGNFVHVTEATAERLREELRDADAVYVDTWIDMEFINDPARAAANAARIAIMAPLQLNLDTYGQSAARILHPMPVHFGYEISREALYHPNSIYLTQAENRYHAQAAILHHLLAG